MYSIIFLKYFAITHKVIILYQFLLFKFWSLSGSANDCKFQDAEVILILIKKQNIKKIISNKNKNLQWVEKRVL